MSFNGFHNGTTLQQPTPLSQQMQQSRLLLLKKANNENRTLFYQ